MVIETPKTIDKSTEMQEALEAFQREEEALYDKIDDTAKTTASNEYTEEVSLEYFKKKEMSEITNIQEWYNDQEDPKPIEKLSDGRIKFPYQYGDYETTLFIKKTDQDSLSITGSSTFKGKPLKSDFTYKVDLITTREHFLTWIGEVLDKVTTTWRRSAKEKGNEAFNLLFPEIKEKELQAKEKELQANLEEFKERVEWDKEKRTLTTFLQFWGKAWNNLYLSFYIKDQNTISITWDAYYDDINILESLLSKNHSDKDISFSLDKKDINKLSKTISNLLKSGIQYKQDDENRLLQVSDTSTIEQVEYNIKYVAQLLQNRLKTFKK